jgi:phenylalanyl-tRNA synthetase beta chain
MLVPLSWLRDFAPFGDDHVALAETFDNLGMVVEGITVVGEGLDRVVVARVLGIEPVPGADRIRKVTVDDGTGAPVEVVCGAFNFTEGDAVAFAQVGAVLPGGLEIGRRKVRGVVSNGMICSPAELRLGDDHSGIMVLPPDVGEPGTPLAEALGISRDVVFDLAIETNRPDALSVAGVARDAAAKLGLPFRLPEPPAPVPAPGGPGARVEVHSKTCTLFSATVLTEVRVGPSPAWLARRLTLAGMRAISNVVDVSNYVMLELGNPNHPYDLDRLGGGGLLVRDARPGERLVTLDGVERVLGTGAEPDCLICDANDVPVGIGGVMGGARAEIDERTATVLLEVAHFERMAIARTAKRLGLRTEASARFERGVDPEGVERAVARFVQLATELAGARCGERTTVGSPPPRRRVRVRVGRVNAILGTDLSAEQVTGYLAPIGFEAAPTGEGVFEVTIPSWRPDAAEEIDVIEEVARHHGYERIPRTVPRSPFVGGLTPYQRDRRAVREVLVGLGLSEAVGPMLVGPGDHARAGLAEGPGDVIRAADPLAREESILRTSLLPGLLRALAFNAGHRNPDVRFFEIGHVYLPPPPGQALPDERERLAVALAGEDALAASGVLRVLLDELHIDCVTLQAAERPGLHPTRTAVLLAGGEELGAVGEVDPDVVAAHGIEGRVGWFELELERLCALPRRDPTARPVSRYPSSDVDLAFVVPEEVPAAAVAETLRRSGGEELESVRLIDVFRGPQVGEGRRSLAFRLRFAALDHTLTDDERAALRRRAIDAVVTAHGAELRS